ncbi:MAG: DUF72 domain-containing protein [Dehalococcoidia bacterium]
MKPKSIFTGKASLIAEGCTLQRMSGKILVGTASWTDKSLIQSGRFYPAEAKTPEARLQFYASEFPLVEVDSSYYGLPSERNAALWVDRTPAGFTFDVKAFALFTQHPVPPRVLPKDLREQLPDKLRSKAHLYDSDLPAAIRDSLWERFSAALLPLESAGKLGVVLFQFPPWFLPGSDSRRYIKEIKQRLPQYTPAIEFRSPSWFQDGDSERTLRFLSDHDLPYVCVDEPQGTRASVPPVVAVTASLALVRFHGRNDQAWAKRNVSVAEKYDYLYTSEELQAWVPSVRWLAAETSEVHLLMNNCREDKAVRNARELASLLGQLPPQPPTSPQPRLL